jgi:hypothetical protein
VRPSGGSWSRDPSFWPMAIVEASTRPQVTH